MISLVIIGIVIGPVGSAMVNATKTQHKAKATYDATRGAEAMMQATWEALDIKIEQGSQEGSLRLGDLLWQSEEGVVQDLTTQLGIQTEPYQTDQFIYDIAIWDMGKLEQLSQDERGNVTGKQLKMSFSNPTDKKQQTIYLDQAMRFSSHPDEANDPQFADEEYMDLEYVRGTLQDQEAMLWQTAEEVVDLSTTVFEGIALLEATQIDTNNLVMTKKKYTGLHHMDQIEFKLLETIMQTQASQQESREQITVYTIQEAVTTTLDQVNELVIYLDMRTLDSSPNNQVIKFVNETPYPVVIKCITKEGTTETIPILLEPAKGHLVVEETHELGIQESYVIGIVVRDRTNNNKIVKKMMDVYSYIRD